MKRLESFTTAVVQSDMTAAAGADKERLLAGGRFSFTTVYSCTAHASPCR